jgi:hypothetical protein
MNIGKKVFALVACACVTTMIACGPDYEKTEVTAVKPSPLGGTASSRIVSVPEGMIVKAHVVSFNDDNEVMQAHVLSHDDSIVEVVAVVNDRDYAFIGKKAGRTEVEFQADGETVFTVIAEVTEQPEPDTTKGP